MYWVSLLQLNVYIYLFDVHVPDSDDLYLLDLQKAVRKMSMMKSSAVSAVMKGDLHWVKRFRGEKKDV